MRYSRYTPAGDVFNFSCPVDQLPDTTAQLSLGLRKGLIKPDILGYLQDDESEPEGFQRLRKDILARLEKYHGHPAPLEKDYQAEAPIRHNINWIPTENL